MSSMTKANLQRAINASGMSTAEQKALTAIVDSAPSDFWGADQSAALTASDTTLPNAVIRIGEIEAALEAHGILAS